MASLITTVSHGNYPQQPKAGYVATAVYNTAFYSYTTSYDANYKIIGTLATVSGATATNCKAGDFLYENGKKLYPGANPGVTTFMVGVYSPITCLSGYIDPNSATFTPMVNGKPYQIQVQDAGSNYVFNADPITNIKDEAQPIFTNGSGQFNSFLSTGTYFTAGTSGSFGTSLSTGTTFTAGTSGSFGTYVSTGTYVKAGTYLASGVVTATPSPSGNSFSYTINPNLGNTFNINLGATGGNGTLTIGNTFPFPIGQEIFVNIQNATTHQIATSLINNLVGQTQTTTNGRILYKFITTSTGIYEISVFNY